MHQRFRFHFKRLFGVCLFYMKDLLYENDMCVFGCFFFDVPSYVVFWIRIELQLYDYLLLQLIEGFDL